MRLSILLAAAILTCGGHAATGAMPPEEIARLRQLTESEPGHPAALTLGMMHELGEGVTQDNQIAAKWYRSCADGGYDACQLHLGRFYADGKGVPKDVVLAYMWLNLAAAQGGTVAAALRDQVAKTMMPAQTAEAQKLSREWKQPYSEAPSWRSTVEAWVSWAGAKKEALRAWPYWQEVLLPQ